uniref:DUF4220 domain-containing protein n=1 Tax=Triticum aestivum TaxID=4565 RepID=A0A080YUX5_WHEAT|nr:unnamed protein product [Triticum aestivum]CDM87228.1 unnamed protein product [Triticum aestivum]
MAQLVDYKFWPSTFQSKAIELFDNKSQMFDLVEMQLSLMHDFLYTKASVVFTWYGCFIRAISSVATITAFFLFQSSIGKNDFNRVDAIVTYILIAGAVLLEMIAVLKAMGSTWTCALLHARRWHRLHNIVVSVRRCVKAAERNRRWSGSIGQPELLNSSHGSGDCVSAQGLAMGCKDLWKKLCHSLPVISDDTKKSVLEEVCRMVGACKGNEDIMRSYSGQSALNPWHGFFEDPTSRAGIDFDEKILCWHFATKIFLSRPSCVEEQDYVLEAIREVSNYMIFLLVQCPYMLPSPVRPGLYANNEATYESLDFSKVDRISRRGKLDNRRRMWDVDTRRDVDELDRVRGKLDIIREELDILMEEGRRRWELHEIGEELKKIRLEVDGSRENLEKLNIINKKLEELDRSSVKLRLRPSPPPALARVAELAVGLLDTVEARGEQEVRRVVLGVWVEMLCYAAHHCSRDSHARQLNSGVAPIVTRIGLRRVWRSSSSHHSISGTAVDGFETTANGYADVSANVSADAADAPGTAADGCADGCADCADSGTAADGFWIVRMVQLRMERSMMRALAEDDLLRLSQEELILNDTFSFTALLHSDIIYKNYKSKADDSFNTEMDNNTLEGDLHHEVAASEDGGGESNPWDRNLFYNLNLQ